MAKKESEITNRLHRFKVISCVMEKTDAYAFTKWQQLICRWFKITPEMKYYYTASIKFEESGFIRLGDSLMAGDCNIWQVVDQVNFPENEIKLKNVVPIICEKIYGEMVIFSNTYSEGTDKSRHNEYPVTPDKCVKEGIFKFGRCHVIVTIDKGEWHLSISTATSLPSYQELKEARYKYCPDNVFMAEIFPPKSEFVNIYSYTRHLWQIDINNSNYKK